VNLSRRSTAAVQGFCKAKVGSSILSAGTIMGKLSRFGELTGKSWKTGSGKTGTRQVTAGVFAEAPKQLGKVE
jgi:hypothetical protein